MTEASTITTHVLDLARGQPAGSLRVTLQRRTGSGAWETLGTTSTDGDGRVASWPGVSSGLEAGAYRLRFGTTDYFAKQGQATFFDDVTVSFRVGNGRHHVPLLLSLYGYSTYRGS